MKRDDFVRNLRGIDAGADLDEEMLHGIYDRLKANEFRPGPDHVSQVSDDMKHTHVHVQGWANKWYPGLVNFRPAVASASALTCPKLLLDKL